MAVRERLSLLETMWRAATSFGHPQLKEEQEQAIVYIANSCDVFMSLPTGYGKSLCYVMLPRLFNMLRGTASTSIVLAVSRLIALMKDQVAIFTVKGILTAYVSDREDCTGATRRSMRKGEHEVMYMSPEALLSTLEMRTMLSTELYWANLVGFIVGEAHSIKKW